MYVTESWGQQVETRHNLGTEWILEDSNLIYRAGICKQVSTVFPEARDCDVFTIDSVEAEAMDSPLSCVAGGFITSMLNHLIQRDR